MPVELPKRSTRPRSVLISVSLLAVSAVVTLTQLPEKTPAPAPKIVGTVAVSSAAPSSAAARVPDALVVPKKKKKKAKPKASTGASVSNTAVSTRSVAPASSGSVVQPTVRSAAPTVQRRSGTSSSKSSGSGGSTNAAEAEFGPG